MLYSYGSNAVLQAPVLLTFNFLSSAERSDVLFAAYAVVVDGFLYSFEVHAVGVRDATLAVVARSLQATRLSCNSSYNALRPD